MSGSRNPNLGIITLETGKECRSWQQNLGRTKMKLTGERDADWWTGLSPQECPGFHPASGTLKSLPIFNFENADREAVLSYFDNGWTLSELLFSALNGEEGFYRPPYHELRHPLVFYYVHPAALYVNKLRVAGLIETGINSYFESLFETGVDEMSWDDMAKNTIAWPAIDEAHRYRKQVYELVKNLILNHPDLAAPGSKTMEHQLWALLMGFEHERIHLETSSVLMRELPLHLLQKPQAWPEKAPIARPEDTAFPPKVGRHYPQNALVEIARSQLSFGKSNHWPTFGWDNEYGRRQVDLPAFAATSRLISNGEFWQFVAEGGYLNSEYWSETGSRWRQFRNIKCPTFWVPDGPAGIHQYKLRTCFEIIPMQWNWPAVVNYHEAQAFCRWKSEKDGKPYNLPSEAEHQAMRAAVLNTAAESNNLLRFGSECATDKFPSPLKEGSAAIYDLFGNLWQWLEDHFHPLPGARVHRYYDDFSTPCYDGEHQMIMGGSFISTGDEADIYARFHFRPHFFQHAGFRLVVRPEGSDGAVVLLKENAADANPYEAQTTLNEYMNLHYGKVEDQMPWAMGPKEAACFPQRCAELVDRFCRETAVTRKRALDIGCAVGGASFHLARTFESVVGIDLSKSFIEAARTLQSEHKLPYHLKLEGDLQERRLAEVDPKFSRRVTFRQADACALPADLLDFDAVLLANLLCRLPSPAACLGRLDGDRGLVKPGGIVVVVSPYTWMERFTPREVWLGGYQDDEGREHYSEEGLQAALGKHFDLLDKLDMPLLIREHERKYQYIVSQAMVFRRRL